MPITLITLGWKASESISNNASAFCQWTLFCTVMCGFHGWRSWVPSSDRKRSRSS